jgi:hypothetical protein
MFFLLLDVFQAVQDLEILVLIGQMPFTPLPLLYRAFSHSPHPTMKVTAAAASQAQLCGFKEISASVPTSLRGKRAAPDGGSGETYG